MTTPSTIPAPLVPVGSDPQCGIENLEARAEVRKKDYRTEYNVFFQVKQECEGVREELEETERKIEDFDDGTCPFCHNDPAKTFQDLKTRQVELERSYSKLHEAVEEKLETLRAIASEVSAIETEVHMELRKQMKGAS